MKPKRSSLTLINLPMECMCSFSIQCLRWKSIKNMLPGSELDQIKEINEKLLKTSTLLTLCIGAHQAAKKRPRETPAKPIQEVAKRKKSEKKNLLTDTLVTISSSILEMPTLPEPVAELLVRSEQKKRKFVLRFVGEPEFVLLAKKSGIDVFEINKENLEHKIERAQFMLFPKYVIARISIINSVKYIGKLHAVITMKEEEGRADNSPYKVKEGEYEIYETAPDGVELLNKTVAKILDKSTNGTFVNGKKLEKGKEERLMNGDVIGLVMKANKEVSVGFQLEYNQ
eukprot:TRINITY_DN71046_c2_g1_i1.p2 TRINITY_DN71046_c2_g1~~TRINITY_DN71046_c2_g1_i1.p2  ORF type:complete len:285 (-),score=38.85 TRINITY_DN71046_c2_g1_i1:1002-1856(-)